MNVAYVAREMVNPPIEGHHTISKRIIEAAIRAGIHQHTITIEPFVDEADSSSGNIIINSKYYADNTGENALISAVTRVANEFASSIKVGNQIKINQFDLVHVLNFTKEAYMLTHKLMRINKPFIIHFYHSPFTLTDDIFVFRNFALRMGLYGRLLNNTVLSVNKALVDFMVTKVGADPKYVHYVPCPVDVERFRPINDKSMLRKKYGLPQDRPIIVYVGSLNSARGIIELIESFKSVLSKIPDALFYISYPQHQTELEYETEVFRKIRTLDLQKNIITAGPSPNIEEIYNLADVMVLPFNRPYWVDPPLVVLEAMSCGAPMITNDVGAIGEIAKDNRNALIVNPGDINSMSEAIADLVNDKTKAQRIGKNARETISQNNSYEIVGTNLLKIYRSLVD
jgi:glycosyltransferase involved in cell wall biosynthesis